MFPAFLKAGDREHRNNDQVMKIPGVMASLTNAIAYIDNIFQLYVIERACYESRRPQPFPYNCEQPLGIKNWQSCVMPRF